MSDRGEARNQRLVVFRYRPERPTAHVDLRGDIGNWFEPTRMAPEPGGWFETSLHLGPGVYQYKFRMPVEEWRLDPSNPRTRSSGGVQNSLLVIGGTPEPVVHAPVSPWLSVDDGGAIRVRAGLRRSAGAELRLRWSEGAERHAVAMEAIASEDEHVFFEARLPGTGSYVEYLFETPDGQLCGADGGAGQAFRVPRATVAVATPDWWRDAVVYTVFVDRFRRGGGGGAWAEPQAFDREHRAGGDLDGVREALPYLRDLGVNTLHLTPVNAAGSVHRYDTIDPRVIAPELGGDAAFERLLEAAHAASMRVIMDLTVTHVSRDFFAFRDVVERGRESHYWDWFYVERYPFREGRDPGYRHYQKGQWQEPLINTDDPGVRDYIVGTFVHWAKRGVDGFRVDAAADVPLALCSRIGESVRRVNRDAVLFGEVVPWNLERWTGPGGLDAATDFGVRQACFDWLGDRSRDGQETRSALEKRRLSRGPGSAAIAFTGTHDQPRVRSLISDPAVAQLMHLLVVTGEAVPALYYGDEVGLAAADSVRSFEDSWPDRQCMPWSEADWGQETLAFMRASLRLRRERGALRRGDTRFHSSGPDTVAFRRQRGEDVVDVFVHRGQGEEWLELPEGGEPSLLLATGDVELDGSRLRLGASSGAVLARGGETLEAELVAANRAIAAMAFQNGEVATPAYPAHLYLTVTEQCNLRCEHCITFAPRLTRERRARQVRPWLLDALAPAFAHAVYFGFVHGGESLVAPIFPEVLRAIQRARAGRPGRTDVHLVTNGMLLDRERVQSLIDLGVTSLMVSLDGASTATNDLIRRGGRFERVRDNIAGAVAVRERIGADLRIGISTVIGKTNVAEVPAVADLAVSLGVDWLKLEETCPTTPFARADFLDPNSSEMATVLRAATETLANRSVTLVNHVNPPAGCRCTGDNAEAIACFRDADDFANRARFYPCRAAWEQACIDPDGVVHPVDYFQPALGSVAEQPFLDVWNSDEALRYRAQALATTPAAQRQACPHG